MTQQNATGAPPLPLLGYGLLVGLTIFWGANWPFMKIALSELPVWWFRSFCLLLGGGGLLIISALSRDGLRVPRKEWRPLLICAVFNIIGWHLCSGYGVSLMPAGRAAIIAFTMPLWATLFGAFILGEAITRAKVLGLGLGLAGLAVLIGPDLILLGQAPLGAGFLVAAALSWGLGTALLKRQVWSISTTSLVGWQLIAGFVPVTLGALVIDPFPDVTALSEPVLWSLAYVIAFPMLFCQWAYFRTVRLFPASIAAIGTLLIPVVGVYSSALILDEPVGPEELLALFLICAGLAAVLLLPVLRRKGSRTSV